MGFLRSLPRNKKLSLSTLCRSGLAGYDKTAFFKDYVENCQNRNIPRFCCVHNALSSGNKTKQKIKGEGGGVGGRVEEVSLC